MKTFWIIILGLVLIGVTSLWGQRIQPTFVALPLLPEDASFGLPEQEIPPTVLFSIRAGENPGDKGITYEGLGEEQTPWGPSAIEIDGDGDIWISDGVANRLIEFDRAGNILRVVPIAIDDVLAIDDFVFVDEGIWISDDSFDPHVTLFDYEGVPLRRHDLTPGSETFMGGLVMDVLGRPAVYIGGSVLVIDQAKNAQGLIWDEEDIPSTNANYPPVVISHNKTLSTDSAAYFTLAAGDVVRHEAIGGDAWMVYVGSDQKGNHFMEVDVTVSEYKTDFVVRRYTPDLKHFGSSRFTHAQFATSFEHPVAVSPDGSFIGAVTHPDRIDIVELNFSRTLDPLDFDESAFAEDVFSLEEALGVKACISRSRIHNNAIEYKINRTYLSNSAISGSCSGRKKPGYLGSAGYYDSVAYDWGGFDTVDMFNHAMTLSSRRAGDTNTSTESCSRGVDCSGFVSRVWERTSKYSTNTLQNISHAINKSQLEIGDILNKAGSHVALFVNTCSTSGSAGYLAYEAVVGSGADRVVRTCRKKSHYDPYKARRYNNVCG